MERVMITPHHASIANPRTAAASVADNMRRVLSGEPIVDQVDRGRGY
jgi:glyoxylate/hydroxypyruvate reductase A